MVRIILIGLCAMTLAGCSLAPGVFLTEGQFEPSADEAAEPLPVTLVPITHETIRVQRGARVVAPLSADELNVGREYQYLVGPQDVLNIIVWEHPELTIPTGGQRPVVEDGNRVRPDGTIFYPYVGTLYVAGKTAAEIRVELTEKLSRYIKQPQLNVSVVAYNSQKVHVAGAVTKPGSVAITDIPLTLSDAVNAAGGVSETADIQEVNLTRDGKNAVYNLVDLYYRGDLRQNVLLRDKDIVYVPMNTMRKVFVLGEVSKQAAIPMHDGRLTLADAMASAGLNQNAADPERIFVLRQGAEKPLAYHLDASEPSALILATAFELQPLDVVFVSASHLTRWNRVLSQLMPTVQMLWTVDRMQLGY
jgi:polysaccharide export outer membrane protein